MPIIEFLLTLWSHWEVITRGSFQIRAMIGITVVAWIIAGFGVLKTRFEE
jgi:hypothetical protein